MKKNIIKLPPYFQQDKFKDIRWDEHLDIDKEYELIKQKKSKLSRSQREFVINKKEQQCQQ